MNFSCIVYGCGEEVFFTRKYIYNLTALFGSDDGESVFCQSVS